MRQDRVQGCFLPCHLDQSLLEEESSSTMITTWLLPKICRADLFSSQYSDTSSADEASAVEGEDESCKNISPSRTSEVGSKSGTCLVNETLSSSNCNFHQGRESLSPISSSTSSDGIDEGNLTKGKVAFTYDQIAVEGFNSANTKTDSCFYDDEFAKDTITSFCCDDMEEKITGCIADDEISMDVPICAREKIPTEDLLSAKEEISICFSDDKISLDRVKPAKKIGYCYFNNEFAMSRVSCDLPVKKKIKSCISDDGIDMKLRMLAQKNDSPISNRFISKKEEIISSISDDEIFYDDITAKEKVGSSCITDDEIASTVGMFDEVSTKGKIKFSCKSDVETVIDGISGAIPEKEKLIYSGSLDHEMSHGNCAEEASSSQNHGLVSSEEKIVKEATASLSSQRSPSAGDSSEAQQDYLPGLDDEVAQRCLAFVSLADMAKLAGVSRRHRMLVQSGLFFQLRRMYGVVERWVCIYTSGDGVWMAYNPVRNVWSNLPRANINPIFEFADRESLSAGAHLLWFGREVFNFACYRYDLYTNSWDVGPPMVNPRCLFASASCGNNAFVAGGFDVGSMLPSVLRSAEMYDSLSGSWTALPPMHTPRQKCSGAFMDGKFYVIGGKDANHNCLTSGEVYDPTTQIWTIIPDMYVQHTSQTFEPSPPLVAVAGNQLYAIESSTNLLKVYNKDTNTWKFLGPVPVRTDICNGWGLAFKALGDELFVIGSYQDCPTSREGVAVFSWKPQFDAGAVEWQPNADPPEWRLVNLRVRGSGSFLYNCAIMVC